MIMRKFYLVFIATVTSLSVGLIGFSNLTNAQDCGATSTKDAIKCGVGGAGGVPVSTKSDQNINDTIATVVNILSAAVGIAAGIMLILGGFRYITSGGDSTKTANAKNTILYALIGLVIVAVSQFIIKFVLTKASIIK